MKNFIFSILQRLSFKTDSRLAGEEIVHLLRTLYVPYLAHKTMQL
jgi:hypothetical protein